MNSMEDDEGNHSQQSAGSSPPSSPQSNGRITVTVASAAPTPPQSQQQPQNSLAIVPIQNSKAGGGGSSGGGGGGGGREDCWSEGATSVLIDAWGERYLELSRGNLKQKHWKEVADIVSSREHYMKPPKTDIQCKNRIDTVKKKYKVEKLKRLRGEVGAKWPFFERLDRLIGTTAKIPQVTRVQVPGVAAGAYYTNPQKVPVGIPVGRALNSNSQQRPTKGQSSPAVMPQFHNPPTTGSRSQHLRQRPLPPVDSDSEPEEQTSPDSADDDSYGPMQDVDPPSPTYRLRRRRRPRSAFESADNPPSSGGATRSSGGGGRVGGGGIQREKENVKGVGWGDSVRELTGAILKLAEAYEHAENMKLQQLVELEKQRMKFAKDLELQRMKIMVKTQYEISQLSRGNGGNRRATAAAASAGGGGEGDDGNCNINMNHNRTNDSVNDDDNGENVNDNHSDSSS